MPAPIEVKVPDIGEFKDVDVVELLVEPGDPVEIEDSLITIESEKASMEVPSPAAGRVKELLVRLGDKVSEGSLILLLEPEVQAESPVSQQKSESEPEPQPQILPRPEPGPAPASAKSDWDADVLVLGSGPGGYAAAFRAADLGLRTLLVERYPTLGGVCLNVGCIPSKALLHAARVIDEAAAFGEHGIVFPRPRIELAKLRAWKDGVVSRLTDGLTQLAKRRSVEVVTGLGRFADPHALVVELAGGGTRRITFGSAIIAVGSRAVKLPFLPYGDARVMDSTGALDLPEVPRRLLVIGGGIIGLEMATVYSALGSAVTVVELLDGLMPGVDRDLVRPLQRRLEKRYEKILVGAKVTAIEAAKDALVASFEGKRAPERERYDAILVAVGRRPNGARIGAESIGVHIDERGFIPVDDQQRTNVPHIYAIGDVAREPLLAHKATHEGKVAAEVIAGHKSGFDARVIPSVAYTDPEVAWVGVTEEEAKAQGREIVKSTFPWAASGRSLALGRDEGLTKLLFDPETRRLVGAGMVGPQAGDLVAEAALAIEMGADAQDLALTIHPHPTLSETLSMAAEVLEGTVTDLYVGKRRSG